MRTLETVSRLTLPALVRAGRQASFHQAVGLDLSQLATLAGHSPDETPAWEGGHYPPDVRSLLMELDHAMNRTAHKLVICIQQQLLEGGPLRAPLALLTFASDADLWHYKPDFRGLPTCVHTALVQRCRAALADLRVRSRAVRMDTAAYTRWLDGRQDSEALRITWATLQP